MGGVLARDSRFADANLGLGTGSRFVEAINIAPPFKSPIPRSRAGLPPIKKITPFGWFSNNGRGET